MGRGLSDLQKRILLMAAEGHERRKTPNIGHGGVDWNGPKFGCEAKLTEIQETVYGANLDKKQRAAAAAAISRANARLAQRGLVTCRHGVYWSGVFLTEQGLELARQLTVNKAS